MSRCKCQDTRQGSIRIALHTAMRCNDILDECFHQLPSMRSDAWLSTQNHSLGTNAARGSTICASLDQYLQLYIADGRNERRHKCATVNVEHWEWPTNSSLAGISRQRAGVACCDTVPRVSAVWHNARGEHPWSRAEKQKHLCAGAHEPYMVATWKYSEHPRLGVKMRGGSFVVRRLDVQQRSREGAPVPRRRRHEAGLQLCCLEDRLADLRRKASNMARTSTTGSGHAIEKRQGRPAT